MGEWVYRKPEPSNVRGTCVNCGERPQKNKGKQGYSPLCDHCHERRNGTTRSLRRREYLQNRKDYCEECGFKALHPCQLDVDHIDGNHDNNDLSNLRTLCANCHRLKTLANGDWSNLEFRRVA